jgi:hypothetical protein
MTPQQMRDEIGQVRHDLHGGSIEEDMAELLVFVVAALRGIRQELAALRRPDAAADICERDDTRTAALRKALEGCERCDLDEAEGGVIDHCDNCRFNITSEAYALFYGERGGTPDASAIREQGE